METPVTQGFGKVRFLVAILATMCFFVACASDAGEGDKAKVLLVPVTGPFTAQVGGFEIRLEAASIGSNANQVPPTSQVRLSTIDSMAANAAVAAAAPGGIAVSPSYRAAIVNPNGGVISGLATAEPHTLRLFPDPGLMAAASPSTTATSLRLVRLVGTTATAITYGATIANDSRFTVDAEGWIVARVTSLGDFVLMSGGTAPGANSLTGTLTEIAGVLAFNLSSTSGETVVVTIPATSATPLPATITANPTTYNTASPTAPTNRGVFLTSGTNQFASFNTGGSATITVTSRSGGVSAGTITGTLTTSTQVSRTVNFTFATTVQGGGTGPSLALEGTRFDISSTANDAHAVAAVWNGTEFVALWLGADGAQGRVLNTRRVAAAGTLVGNAATINANATFSGGLLLSAAYGDDGVRRRILVVGSNAVNESGSVIALMLDQNGVALAQPLEIQVTTAGGAPRVTWNDVSDRFVVTWATTTGISAATYDTGGMLVGVPATIVTQASTRVGGISSGNTNEVLITYTTGTGVKGRRFDSATAANVGAEIEFSTTGGGGVAAFDTTVNAWLVATEGGGQRAVVRLAPGSSTPAAPANLLLPGTLQAAAGGANGAVFVDLNTVTGFGTVFSYQGVAGGTAAAVPHAAPLSPQVTSGVGFPFHDAQGPLALASNGSGLFLVVASDRDGAGVTALRLRLNSGT